MVTEADRASELLIRDLIGRARPDDAFLGEEGDDVAGTSGVRWVVDPIDGTVNFLYGLPQYAVSIAAEVDGEVVAGIVLDVASGTEYVARPGPDGVVALRDGEPIAVRDPAPLGHRLIGTGFSYEARKREIQGPAWRACSRGCATSGGWAPARSTSAWWPTGGSTATSRRASTSGTTRPPAWSREPPERAPRSWSAPAGRRSCSVLLVTVSTSCALPWWTPGSPRRPRRA